VATVKMPSINPHQETQMNKPNNAGRVLGRILAQEQIEMVSGGSTQYAADNGTDYGADSSASADSPFPTYPGEAQTSIFADRGNQQER
jgi:hypothetical protein